MTGSYDPDGGPSARVVYATQLSEQQVRAGWTLTHLSSRCHYEQSYLHRLETGHRLGTAEAAAALDRVYGTGTLLLALWYLAKREAAQRPVTHLGLTRLEVDAAGIQEYALSAVTDLLQTAAYAEEQIRSAGPCTATWVDAQVSARLARQERLTSGRPVLYRALIDESVLRRAATIGVWADQVQHLIKRAQEPDITVRIVPDGTGPGLLAGPLELVALRDGRTVAYTRSSWSGHFVEDPDDVERLRLAYDVLRDRVLGHTQTLDRLHTA